MSPPPLGFGTWNLVVSDRNATEAVSLAIQTGYRHIDCASAYDNEPAVGAGIAQGLQKAGLRREDIWVTSKLYNDAHGNGERVLGRLEKTISDLGVGYLDLYLMHWPFNEDNEEEYIETWKSLESLPATGKVRHIGICNFSPKRLDKLLEAATIRPAVHQMELHPYLHQTKWVRLHQKHGIHVTAYSPLGNMNPIYHDSSSSRPPLLLENEDIRKIAARRGCTPAQVAISWGLSRGTSVIVKSKHESYIKENFGSPECKLKYDDYEIIEFIEKANLTRFNNPGKWWGVDIFEGLDDP